MDTTPFPPDAEDEDDELPDLPETPVERAARLEWEAEMIAEALASVARGDVYPAEDVHAWLDSLGTDNPLPRPDLACRAGR